MGYCTKCERRWGSKVEAHCKSCCNHFSRVSVFDKHRSGGMCLGYDEMIAKKMVYDAEKDIWKGEALPEGIKFSVA